MVRFKKFAISAAENIIFLVAFVQSAGGTTTYRETLFINKFSYLPLNNSGTLLFDLSSSYKQLKNFPFSALLIIIIIAIRPVTPNAIEKKHREKVEGQLNLHREPNPVRDFTPKLYRKTN